MNASRLVSQADALYFGVAIAVTVIELAMLATTPGLGRFALEYAFIAQLTISMCLEFGAAFFIISFLGIIRSVSTGFFLKAASCCLFYFGILIAQNFFLLAWFLLLSSFVLDSIGTGVLRATFRPAYSALHFDKEGRPADFVSILRSSLGIRIGLPCVLLFLTYLIQTNIAEGWVIVSLLVLVMACRSSQIFLLRKT